MVLQERIELSTSPLPRECSTTELRQQARGFMAQQTRIGRTSAPRGGRCVPQGHSWRKLGRATGNRQNGVK